MQSSLLNNVDLKEWLTPDRLASAAKVAMLLLMASLLSSMAGRLLHRLIGSRMVPQHAMLARRILTYGVWALALLLSLQAMSINLTPLLGAVGIISGAAVFASQRGLSQAFSGLILVAERPFNVGDTITLGGVTGEVLSVDLLSTKLRTPDNLFVRVPNETTLNSTITTISHFPIRRLDIQVGVAYAEDVDRVSRVLFEVAEKNPLGLEDPKPVFMFTGLGESSLEIQFCVWGRRERFLDLKNSMHTGIVNAFTRHGIDIPFPHRALVVGGKQESLSVHVGPSATASHTHASTSPAV